ncbi:MAG: AraC family transcriptional regulator [Lachnospiraceae bacterium]|nr:helix-turn-helix transcriptional regulator [Lachnospiraceae bacterium]MCR5509993.1 AraC family transcriptional regulator [Lachnospiraceae bacterium]
MIENLQGIFETVNHRGDTNIRLYMNDLAEDYPPHWHSSMEIIMPLESYYIAEVAGHRFELREGDVLFIFPCNLHTLYAPPKGKRIIFQPEMQFLHQLKEIDAILSLMAPVRLITANNAPDIYPDIRKLLLEIADEYQFFGSLSEAIIYSKLLEMLVIAGRYYMSHATTFDSTGDKRQEYTAKFITICDYIANNCTEELSLDQMADLSGFSKFHFSRLFKQFSGQTFYQYVSHKRIEHAELLLAREDLSITDVATASGFESLSAFIRMFKQIKGMTPTQYRKMRYA